MECNCNLWKKCQHPKIVMDGDPLTVEILFVGEGPGSDEDASGKPFVGRAGTLLRDAVNLAGLKNVGYTNVVRCRPPNNRDPSTPEVKACSSFLEEELTSIPNLKLIVAVGNISLRYFIGRAGITKVSGQLVGDHNKIPVFALMHPAYVRRNQYESKKFYEHVQRIQSVTERNLVTQDDLGTYYVVKTFDEWKKLVKDIRKNGYFVYDIETTGLNAFATDERITCISFSIKPKESYVLPIPSDFEYAEELKMLFESKRIGKIGHSIKFDNLWMKKMFGIDVVGTMWDTQVSQVLINENELSGLKELAWQYTKLGGYEKLLGGKPHEVSGQKLWDYCATDSDISHRLYFLHKENPELTQKMRFTFTNLLMPAAKTLERMEYSGIKIDLDVVDNVRKKVDQKIEEVKDQIKQEKSVQTLEDAEDIQFNPNSHPQLQRLLFKYEGLPITKTTEKTGVPSTDQEILSLYVETSNICKLLLEYSNYSTFRGKTIQEIINQTTPDKRIHTSYWLTEAKTGRSSSSRPNLQNVPKDVKDLLGIRKAFVADKGYWLVEFDFNQHELRVMAEESGDANLMAALAGDVHTATAATILGKKPEEVTKIDRDTVGKVFNFGLIYGMSVFGIMNRLKCDEATATRYLNRFFSQYSKVKMWMSWVESFVKSHGYIESRTGRRRRFPVIDWNDRTVMNKVFREAVNAPVQSLAGDILLYSLIGVDNFLKDKRSFLTLEVHDSLVCNIHWKEEKIIPEIENIMLTYFKNFIDFKTPLKVNISRGRDWGSMEEI